ncbi:hypothetical protein DFH07DRAFT_539783 [Mycena maculata]|uniref:HNH nuclease domain-containing protein n=1 Tax=Mycena maculata TaxID=230809 RepID=A0AAD7KA70_9AGAR|nr:hypothetical protein DFH07DRAFT_539783 [Mycena maculata]
MQNITYTHHESIIIDWAASPNRDIMCIIADSIVLSSYCSSVLDAHHLCHPKVLTMASTPPPTDPQQGDKRNPLAAFGSSDSPLDESPTPDGNVDSRNDHLERPSTPTPRYSTRSKKSLKSAPNASTSGSRPARASGDGSDEEFVDPPSDGWDSEPEHRLEIEEEIEEDDPLDPTFLDPNRPVPRYRRVPKPGASPAKRVPVGASIQSGAKKLVKDSDPNLGHCLLTGTVEPEISNQMAHVVPRATKSLQLTMLEYYWRILYWSLYIDSRFNIFPLKVDWHKSMDAGLWALVPHHLDIAKVRTWVEERALMERKRGDSDRISKLWEVKTSQNDKDESKQPKIKKHKYFMLPLSDTLRTVPLYRLQGEFDPAVAEARHVFPYKTLGPLFSHIQPHFVIYAVGMKLAELEKAKLDGDAAWLEMIADNASFGHPAKKRSLAAANLESLRNIQYIYEQWTHADGLPDPGNTWYATKPKEEPK